MTSEVLWAVTISNLTLYSLLDKVFATLSIRICRTGESLRYMHNELLQLLKDAVGDEGAYRDAANRNTVSYKESSVRHLTRTYEHNDLFPRKFA